MPSDGRVGASLDGDRKLGAEPGEFSIERRLQFVRESNQTPDCRSRHCQFHQSTGRVLDY